MGVGLKNTNARLWCLYSNLARLSFEETENCTAVAMIVLPAFASPLLSREFYYSDESNESEGDHARVGGR